MLSARFNSKVTSRRYDWIAVFYLPGTIGFPEEFAKLWIAGGSYGGGVICEGDDVPCAGGLLGQGECD